MRLIHKNWPRLLLAGVLPLIIILSSACTAAPALETSEPDVGETASPSTVDRSMPAHPVVRVRSGALQGALEDNVLVFKGIPYAAPPVGDLRWREPQPVVHGRG